MNNTLVSVIIPAKNSQFTIKKCLDSLLNSGYKAYELIVINDGSTDDTENILSGYNNIKVLKTEGVGPSQARNIGISQAKGEFIAFTDADCIVENNWLEELLKSFIDDKVAGVGGSQKSPEDDTAFGKRVQEFFSIFGFAAEYVKSGVKIRATNHNPTCNSMYRKAVLIEAGGFLESLWPGEDVELDYRIKKKGYCIIFNPAAVVYHYRSADINKFSAMMFRYGKSQGFLVRKYGLFRGIQALPFVILVLLGFVLTNLTVGLGILIMLFTGVFFIAAKGSKYPLVILKLFWVALLKWNLGYFKGIFMREYSA